MHRITAAIHRILGSVFHKLGCYRKAVFHLSKVTDGNRPRAFISYRSLDKGVVLPFVNAILSSRIPVYIDLSDKPAHDPHSLAVGLSEGLVACPILVAFISREYLRSEWCTRELREFIYLHGKKLSPKEMANIRLSVSDIQQDNFTIPKIPAIMVLLEQDISDEAIAEAVSPEDMLEDTLNRVIAIRGHEDQDRHRLSLDYVRKRGIDASCYVKDIAKLAINKRTIEKSFDTLIHRMRKLSQQVDSQKDAGDLE